MPLFLLEYCSIMFHQVSDRALQICRYTLSNAIPPFPYHSYSFYVRYNHLKTSRAKLFALSPGQTTDVPSHRLRLKSLLSCDRRGRTELRGLWCCAARVCGPDGWTSRTWRSVALVPSSFLLLLVRPGAPSSFLLLVAWHWFLLASCYY